MSKKVTLLGSTGSIGTQSLDVIRAEGFEVSGLAAHTQTDLLLRQVEEFHPAMVAVTDERAADKVQAAFANMVHAPRLLRGAEGLRTLAAQSGADVVLNAVVGAAGLPATLAALESGCDVALANKESLVTGGALVLEAAEKHNAKLLPVDSEHSAIFQCLQDAYSAKSLQKILLTASGGPFFGKTREELLHVTKEDALRHPNWSMGAKITIDSATMMNKGLEIMEASWLFHMPPSQIDVVIHRESVIHSLVEYADNSVIAQLGVPDMRIPIQYAVTWPERFPSPVQRLSLADWGTLTFYPPDEEAFPAMGAARRALARGGLAPAALNGANEMAVSLFLEGKLPFLRIAELAEEVSQAQPAGESAVTLNAILDADRAARDYVLAHAGL